MLSTSVPGLAAKPIIDMRVNRAHFEDGSRTFFSVAAGLQLLMVVLYRCGSTTPRQAA